MNTNTLAYSNFDKNIASCEDLINLYKVITEKIPELQEQSYDILRASLVLSVSALDTYLHDFFRTEIVESFLDKSRYNVNFDEINISIGVLREITLAKSEEEKKNLLNQELRRIQKEDSYQSNKSVEYIFNKLGLKKIWTELENVGVNNLKAGEIKEELANIINRRNKIAHESDWDYVNDRKYNIAEQDAISVVDFIKSFVTAISKLSPKSI